MKLLEERLRGREEDCIVVVQKVATKLDEHSELFHELSRDVHEQGQDIREIKARMTTVEIRMGVIDMRLNRMDQRLDSLDERLDSLGEEMRSKFDQIIALLTQLDKKAHNGKGIMKIRRFCPFIKLKDHHQKELMRRTSFSRGSD